MQILAGWHRPHQFPPCFTGFRPPKRLPPLA